MHGQYQGKSVLTIVTKWLNEAVTVQEGEVLCYDVSASAPGSGDPSQDVLGIAVKTPATANLGAVAGVVADTSAGKTGPCWVDLIQAIPGDVAPVRVSGTITAAGTTALGPVNASRDAAPFADSTLNLPVFAVPLESGTITSSLVLAKFR